MMTLHTDGSGLWSTLRETIPVTDIKLAYTNDKDTFGELRVYFDTECWNVSNDGLIYTDRLFLKELRGSLDSMRLPGKDVSYSEAGMQGDDYVSLDVGADFIQAWRVHV